MAKILLIDDEFVVVQTLSALLKSEGHDVAAVYEGSHALPLLGPLHQYDLMLVDLRMTPVDGIEVIMKARKFKPRMPIIVVSAYLDENMLKRIKALGVSRFIKKPFTVNEILDAVHLALGTAA
ncbi:MAG: response regulator [Kiritimatiellae bacterium]|nr:response regulator [Kiritimatiellia bacterium]